MFKFLATSSHLTKLYLAEEQREKDELALLCLCGCSPVAPARWATLCPPAAWGHRRQLQVAPGCKVPQQYRCYWCRAHLLLSAGFAACRDFHQDSNSLMELVLAAFACCSCPSVPSGKCCCSTSQWSSEHISDSTDSQGSDSFSSCSIFQQCHSISISISCLWSSTDQSLFPSGGTHTLLSTAASTSKDRKMRQDQPCPEVR